MAQTKKATSNGQFNGQVDINLDTLEREGAPVEPFRVVVGGETLVMNDPSELGWSTLMNIDSTMGFLELVLGEDKLTKLVDSNVPGWKLQKLMELYFSHYGIDPEKLAASGGFSAGTSRR